LTGSSIPETSAIVRLPRKEGNSGFAVLLNPSGTGEPGQKSTHSVIVLLNFFDELRSRVPSGKN
jgi:hypothetical protein